MADARVERVRRTDDLIVHHSRLCPLPGALEHTLDERRGPVSRASSPVYGRRTHHGVHLRSRQDQVFTGKLGSGIDILRRRQVGLAERHATRTTEHVVGRQVNQSRRRSLAGASQHAGRHRVHSEGLCRLGLTQVDGLEYSAVDGGAGPMLLEQILDALLVGDIGIAATELHDMRGVAPRDLRSGGKRLPYLAVAAEDKDPIG